MNKLLIISAALLLAACQKNADTANTDTAPVNASAPTTATSATGKSTVRQNFQAACVQSALGKASKESALPEKVKFAETMCECVYEEGTKAYGSETAWVKAIESDEKKPDAEFVKIGESALKTCFDKHLPSLNSATASAASAAK